MQLFEYAIVMDEKRNKDGDVTEAAEVLVAPKTLLAKDQAQATILAAREIPESHTTSERLDRVKVAVRPF